jgi:hypothetical protein
MVAALPEVDGFGVGEVRIVGMDGKVVDPSIDRSSVGDADAELAILPRDIQRPDRRRRLRSAIRVAVGLLGEGLSVVVQLLKRFRQTQAEFGWIETRLKVAEVVGVLKHQWRTAS